MTTLLGILDIAGAKDEIGKDMARNMADKIIIPWSRDNHKGVVNVKGYFRLKEYQFYDAMDYEHMEEMPEKINFIFDASGKYFERDFGIDYISRENKIVLPNQPNENLTSIALGKNPTKNLVYLIIGAGEDIMPGRIVRMWGNVDIPEDKPILYGWIPRGSEKFKGHIEILIPKNLTYP